MEGKVLNFPFFPDGLQGAQHSVLSAEHKTFWMMLELLSAPELWSLS